MKTNPAVIQGLVAYYLKTGERCKVSGIENIDGTDTAVVLSENDQDEMEIDVDRFWDAYVTNRDDVVHPGLQVKARSDGAHYAVVTAHRTKDKLGVVELMPIGDYLRNADLAIAGNRFWDMFEPLAESDVVRDSDDDADEIFDLVERDDECLSLIDSIALEAPVPFTTSQRHDLDVAIASGNTDDVAAIMDRNVRLRYAFAKAMMRECAKRAGEQ